MGTSSARWQDLRHDLIASVAAGERPAAGLTVIVYEIIQDHGMDKLAIVVLPAGLFQIQWAWLQLSQWFRAVSPAVVHRMLAGIGVLIMASQLHVMIDDLPHGSGLANLATLPMAVWKG